MHAREKTWVTIPVALTRLWPFAAVLLPIVLVACGGDSGGGPAY